MKYSVLSSGSKGNVSFLEIGNKRFLLDAGRNYNYIKKALNEINIPVESIDYIIVTHSHSDHISALELLLNKTNATLIISEQVFCQIDRINNFDRIIICEDEITIDQIKINSIKASHDAKDTRNYVISYDSKKIGYITDTGYINKKNFEILKNLDVYLFESNHDIELLQNGPYPAWLKKRVLSDEGHLSNKLASFYLTKLIGSNTKKIVLIHLSETNNLEEIALETIRNTFIDYRIEFDNISCARQDERTDMVEI